MTCGMTAAPEDLDTIWTDLWAGLSAAKSDRRAAWHTPVIGTADGDLRVMVLRHVDVATATLRFHTDVRSPKVALIGAQPAVSLLFYDASARLQLRCGGIGRVAVEGAEADAAWAASSAASRRCYLAPVAPSSAADAATSGLLAEFESRLPTLAESEAGRVNFAILTVALERIDWLHLAHDGHRRAGFLRSGDEWARGWRVP